MIGRDKVYKILKTKESDGMGGTTSVLSNLGYYLCRVSVGDNPLEAEQYGVKQEQILHIISDLSFDDSQKPTYPTEAGEKWVPESGGVRDYNKLENKPTINTVTVVGDKSLADYGIQPAGDYMEDGDVGALSNIQIQSIIDSIII